MYQLYEDFLPTRHTLYMDTVHAIWWAKKIKWMAS